MAHFSTSIEISLAGNVLSAMTYGKKDQSTVETHSRLRMDKDQSGRAISMLLSEHGHSNKIALREVAPEITAIP